MTRKQERIDSIRNGLSNLLTIEVNTIIKDDMTAEKMPPLPFALLDIIHGYACKLQVELGIDLAPYLRPTPVDCWNRLVESARSKDEVATHVRSACAMHKDIYGGSIDADKDVLDTSAKKLDDRTTLELFNCLSDLWGVFASPAPTDAELSAKQYGEPGKSFSMEWVTNGWDTFERLRRAAIDAQREGLIAKDQPGVTRIIINCSHLKYRVQSLQQKPPARGDAFAKFEELVPQTRDELQRTGARHKEIPHDLLTPEQMVIVRKAWEIGTEDVVVQTCVQVDGDVFTRVSRQLLDGELAEHHDRILAAHQDSIKTGVSHWHAMVAVAKELITELAGAFSGR